MIQRGGEIVIRMMENVQQKTIGPLVKRTIAPGSVVYTDEYDICARLPGWGDTHRTGCRTGQGVTADVGRTSGSTPESRMSHH